MSRTITSSRRGGWAASLLAAALLAAPGSAAAAIPAAATYDARITGAVYEYSSLAGQYQPTGAVDLPALLFIEPRRTGPRPDSPVVGLFTGQTPALDTRPGAINFATNTQGFHVRPGYTTPTLAAIDVATVTADPVGGLLQAAIDTAAARTVTVELFRTSASFISAPAQILAGTMQLQFSPDGRTVTGSLDLGGNGLIEPGNPLFPVRRYVAQVGGQATSITPAPDGGGAPTPDLEPADPPALDRVRAPGGLRAARRRGVALTLSCSGPCRVRARLALSRATARRAGLGGTRIVGARSASLGQAGSRTLRVRLTRRAFAALRRLRRVPVSVRVTVTGADGTPSTFRRRLVLRR